MTMEIGDRKRKHEAEKKIFMLVTSEYGSHCGGIFDFNIQITTNYHDDEDCSLIVKSHDLECMSHLYPVYLLCKQREVRTGHIGGCYRRSDFLIVKDYKLYMFLDDRGHVPPENSCCHRTPPNKEHTLEPPCIIYNLKTGKEEPTLPTFPQSRKVAPIITFVGNELFALSRFTRNWHMVPEPYFESLLLLDEVDDDQHLEGGWKDLPYGLSEIRSLARCQITGYAVLGEDFILVSLLRRLPNHNVIYYSYSVRTKTWKETDPPSLPDDLSTGSPWFLHNEALVIGHDIHYYHPYTMKLNVFSYTVHSVGEKQEPHLSLVGPIRPVRGLEGFDMEARLSYGTSICRSSALAKIDDHGLFCLLHTIFPKSTAEAGNLGHNFRASFVLLKDRDSCEVIKSFTGKLFAGTELEGILFQSCHVLPLDIEEEQDQHRGKRAAKDTDDETSKMGMDCGGTRESLVASQVEAAM